MQLGQAETLGMFHHHDGGFGHIHPHLDHRGGDKKLDIAGLERGHGGIALRRFQLAMHQPDFFAKNLFQHGGAVLGGSKVYLFGFLHQRADPIGALAAVQRLFEMLDQVIQPVRIHHPCFHRLSSRRPAGDLRHVHVAECGQRKRARDRCRRHYQHIGWFAFALQAHALMHAEAMLFVDHRQTQIVKGDVFRKQGMGADQYVDLACRQRRQHGLPARAFFPPGQRRQPHARGFGVRLHRGQMLTHQDFGRRHQRALQAGFHRVQKRQQGDNGLARSDIALQQPQHAFVAGHVFFDFTQSAELSIGEGKGQGGDGLGAQLAIAGDTSPGGPAQLRPYQGQRKLVGQKFVIGQPPPPHRIRRQVRLMHRRMGAGQRLAERREAFAFQEGRVLPFRQHGHALQRAAHCFGERLGGQALGQGIDRLMGGKRRLIRHHIIGMGHLQAVLETFDAPGNDPPRFGRQNLHQIFGVSAEEHQIHHRGVVRDPDLVGLAFYPGRNVIQHAHHHGGDAPRRGGVQFGTVGTVNHPHRQIEDQVRHQRPRHLGDQFFQLGAHPGQGADTGEKRKQNRRAHYGKEYGRSSFLRSARCSQRVPKLYPAHG